MKNTREMGRTEIINELAGHAHPTWYHSLLGWETYQLRELLAYYQGERNTLPANLPHVYRTKGLGDTGTRKDETQVIIITVTKHTN